MRISLDAGKRLAEEPGTGHNRWHPDIPPIARIGQSEELTLETRDGIDGQLTAASSHADAANLNLGLGHPMTGPVYVEGAVPGDVLEVELVAFEAASFGVAAIIPGFGFLADLFPEPFVARFELRDGFASSEELPGVALPADIFPGVVGVAPSHELLSEWRRREDELRERGGSVADPLPEEAVPTEAAAGARTIPPREAGGNMDVRGLVAGSRLYLPVHVQGALFSIGDLHFSQGDGESCGTGIEMAGAATVRFKIHKNAGWVPTFPAYESPPAAPRRTFATTGVSVDRAGSNEDMDLTLATRRAMIEMIDWLGAEHGLGPEAAYVLVSIAADMRLSEIVDVPNPMVSAVIPLDIFDRPTPESMVLRRRRQEAAGAIATERRKEEALRGRLVVARRDATAWEADAAVTAGLDEATVATLRDLGFLAPEPGADAGARLRERVADLERQLDECGGKRAALEAYSTALDASLNAPRSPRR